MKLAGPPQIPANYRNIPPNYINYSSYSISMKAQNLNGQDTATGLTALIDRAEAKDTLGIANKAGLDDVELELQEAAEQAAKEMKKHG